MAKTNNMENIKIELNKLLIQWVITKDDSLLSKIKELENELDYFNYGIK